MLKTTVIPRIGEAPVEIDGSTVIISDEFGNPLVVVTRVADQTSMVSTFKDEDFNRILSSLGIDKVVVDNELLIDRPHEDAELLFDPRKRQQLILGARG